MLEGLTCASVLPPKAVLESEEAVLKDQSTLASRHPLLANWPVLAATSLIAPIEKDSLRLL